MRGRCFPSQWALRCRNAWPPSGGARELCRAVAEDPVAGSTVAGTVNHSKVDLVGFLAVGGIRSEPELPGPCAMLCPDKLSFCINGMLVFRGPGAPPSVPGFCSSPCVALEPRNFHGYGF